MEIVRIRKKMNINKAYPSLRSIVRTTPTGAISFSDINTELGFSSNSPISLNDLKVRKLANKPSGTISFDDLRGKRATFDKIRFKSNSWNTKDNYGTRLAVLYNKAGIEVYRIATTIGTFEDKTFDIPIATKIFDLGKLYFERFIDTSSDGGASMEVWVYTSYNATWTKIITDNSYRTGSGWEGKNIAVDIVSI